MDSQEMKDIKVFICYAREDSKIATKLYADLERAGVSPWIDTEDLKPGEKWKIVIPEMMEKSSYVLILLSSRSISKRGFVQHEIKEALKLSETFPSSAIFIIPVRLEDCESPVELEDLHWVDLFPEYAAGLSKLLQVLAPEGRDALLFRKIQRLAEEYKRLQREKGLETESDALTRLETEMTEVQTQRQRAEEQLHDLHKPPPKQEPPRKVIIRRKAEDGESISLRSEPLTVPQKEFKKVFGLDEGWRPLEYIQNDYEAQGDVVIDYATGLMWQKSDSGERLTYPQAKEYVKMLNSQKFASHDDWRLPTIPELMSLLELEKQSNGLYMSPIFAVKDEYYRCWSADRVPKSEGGSLGAAWLVYFVNGVVGWYLVGYDGYVRCVCPLQQESPHARQEPEWETTPKPPSQKSSKVLVAHLRSETITVSEEESIEVFKLDEEFCPLEYIQNEYEDQGDVVLDHATGLMWQKAGSDEPLMYEDAQKYVEELNRQKFAGYDDWRLPTIPELMSLLEPGKQSNDLYINPLFDAEQWWCWSVDRLPKSEGASSGAAWGVNFSGGHVNWDGLNYGGYVRCIRSRRT